MKLSIITINLNNKEGLEKTLNSIKKQRFRDFDYLIIDGNSIDGSQDLIEDFPFKHYYISEKDNGVYDAMNKGIRKSQGEYLLFLNSGDQLHQEDTLQKIIQYLDGTDIVYGNLIFDDRIKPYVHRYPETITFAHLFESYLPHPASFIKRELFEKFGYYDLNYKIAADWAFFTLVIGKHKASTKYIDEIISVFNLEGLSSNPENSNLINSERESFLKKEFSLYYEDYKNLIENQNTLNRIKSSKGFRILKALGVKKFQ